MGWTLRPSASRPQSWANWLEGNTLQAPPVQASLQWGRIPSAQSLSFSLEPGPPSFTSIPSCVRPEEANITSEGIGPQQLSTLAASRCSCPLSVQGQRDMGFPGRRLEPRSQNSEVQPNVKYRKHRDPEPFPPERPSRLSLPNSWDPLGI